MKLRYSLLQNNFYKKFQVLEIYCFSVSGKTGRPARSTGACVWACTSVHVRRSTAGSTDWEQVCSRVFWVDRPVDRQKETVFLLKRTVDPAVDRSSTALCQQGDGWPDRSTVRPAKCPTALSSLVQFWNLFLGLFFLADFFWVLWIFFRSNKLKTNKF